MAARGVAEQVVGVGAGETGELGGSVAGRTGWVAAVTGVVPGIAVLSGEALGVAGAGGDLIVGAILAYGALGKGGGGVIGAGSAEEFDGADFALAGGGVGGEALWTNGPAHLQQQVVVASCRLAASAVLGVVSVASQTGSVTGETGAEGLVGIEATDAGSTASS